MTATALPSLSTMLSPFRAENMVSPTGGLFIGDPHVSSVKPGKLTDDFLSAVLSKLSQAATLCCQKRLIPVVLGDLIHRDAENSNFLRSKLTLALKEFPCIPLEVNGNHGKHSTISVPEDIEFDLNAAGTLELMDEAEQVREWQIDGKTVRLLCAPYGTALPESVPVEQDVFNILVSHHDLAFQGAYPGAQVMAEIPGLDMLVNGHMHGTAPTVRLGKTAFFCPGNISRLSTDTKNHKPAVWEWQPAFGQELKPHYLECIADCFDLAGKLVAPSGTQAAIAELVASEFAQILKAEAGDNAKTDEAAFLADDLAAVMADLETSAAVRELLHTLAAGVSQASAAEAAPA
jgi:hypothetical protein